MDSAPTHRQHPPGVEPSGWFVGAQTFAPARLAPAPSAPGTDGWVDARRAKQPEGLLSSCNPGSNGRRPC
jgi:hypothetical protein